jgi:hypothetical protein
MTIKAIRSRGLIPKTETKASLVPYLSARRLRILIAIFIAGAFFLAANYSSAPLAQQRTEDRLIRLYLYNFLLFVDWPSDISDDMETVRIAVLGRHVPSGFLQELHGKTIKGKKLIIEYIKLVSDLKSGYQVLFIRDLDLCQAREAIHKVEGDVCLTMSNIKGFTGIDGMVTFLTHHERQHKSQETTSGNSQKRFRINLSAVNKAGLKIRSRLLRLSEIVGDIPNGRPHKK